MTEGSKKEDWFMRLMSVVIICSIMFIGCNVINHKLGLKDDNVIEFAIEEIIEYQTGISLDLTPENPDDDDYSLDIWEKD